MAKFKIYSASGVEKAVGYLSFTGTYMKAGVLDFREIASPTPIAWAIGDYVDYTRTGRRYKLYTIPQVKKQARSSSYGGAFIYQNVQFFDDSHQGDICPFRDLVPGDNRVHFSTQPQISVFDNVAGIAERLQACLEDMYGAGSWVVRTATAQDGAPQELLDLMADEREFVVSGVSVTGALEKVYEIWPEVGFVYTIENGVNTLIIGGAGLNANEDTYKYGKGYGLTSLSKVVANADDMANRLYVYGSARNMLARWYSQFDIKDADSVDIQHLMLPISVWGETDGKPDPAKAFIETEDAEANLRPKTVYFDGSGDLKEIYPTIRENTIQDLWDVMPEGADYRPDTSVWDGDERIDKLLSAQATFDSGLAANNGKSAIQNISWDAHVSSSTSQTIRPNISVPLFARDFTLEEAGSLNFDIVLNVNGTIALPGAQRVVLRAMVHKGSAETYPKFIDQSIELEKSVDSDAFILAPASFSASRVQFDPTRTILVSFFLEIATNASTGTATLAIDMDGSLNVAVSRYRAKTFTVSLRQLGFDISAQADLGEGKTMVMRSGKCVGRAFKISSTAYNSATDTWDVELIRSNDESLSQWFPNSTYPVEADDEFVLTEIAMPGIYISLAEIKLLAAARELLADTSKEQWQYTPDIDAKFMVESGRTILPATNVTIEDEIVPGGSVSMLVDSVTISEGDAAIPIYKVTLRDKKRKSYSDKASVQETSSVPVSTPAQTASKAQRTVINDSFFEEDGDGGIKLKDKYTGLWAEGFMTAGGIGSGGGGGGEGATLLEVWRSLTNNPSLVDSDITPALAIAAAHIPIGNGLTINPQTGLIDVTVRGGVTSVAGMTGDISAAQLATALGISDIDDKLSIISVCLQSLQSQIDSVASRNEFDELAATAFHADIITTPLLYAEVVSLNGVDLNTRLVGISADIASEALARASADTTLTGAVNDVASRATSLEGRATSLEGKFTGDSANSALRLAGTSTYSIWGVEYWASGVPKSVTGRPGLFIGSTQVQTSNSPQAIAGITTLTASGLATIAGGISLGGTFEGVDSKIVWDATNSAWHLIGNFYADGFIVAGGAGSSGGGGDIDLPRVWESLTNNTDFPNTEINPAHIPDMANVYGYLKGNQTITLTGVVTGSGATTIATSIANNALSISMVNGLQAALDSKTSNVGTVTSVGLSMPTGFSVSSSPITASGTLSVSFASGYSLLTSTQISTWNGKQDAIRDLDTIRTNAANGATAYGWGNHASAGYFKASSFTAANIASTLGNTAVNRATADASGENISDKFGIAGVALQSLQSQIDSLASKNAFDELSVTVLNADMVTATTAYLETIYGSLQGNALTASYLYSQSYSAGSPVTPVYFTSGRPAPCSYSFGNANGNAPINNGILNTNLWANYATCDSSNENISDKFGIVSVALQSLQSQVDSVASRNSFDELSATILHADMLTVGAQVNVSGSIFSDEGIYTNGYLTGGGVVSSSDRRLKDEITKVDAERAWEVLMALNPVEWVWNENNAHLYGRRSAGLVAQEVFDVLPYSVFHDGKYDALRYDVFHAFEIAGLQDHEARIRTLEAENKELKRQVELLTR